MNLPSFNASGAGSSSGISMEQAAAGIPVFEQIVGPEGPITIKFIGWPTWDVLDFLENYIKLRKGVLKKQKQEANVVSKEDQEK